MATNILIVLFAISAVGWLYGYAITGQYVACAGALVVPNCNPYSPMLLQFTNPSAYSASVSMYNVTSNATSYTFSDQAFSYINNWIWTLLALMIAGGIILTAIGFPNPYVIFAPIAIIFFNLAVVPYTVIEGLNLPQEFTIIFAVAVNILFVIATVSWWKGGDTP